MLFIELTESQELCRGETVKKVLAATLISVWSEDVVH